MQPNSLLNQLIGTGMGQFRGGEGTVAQPSYATYTSAASVLK